MRSRLLIGPSPPGPDSQPHTQIAPDRRAHQRGQVLPLFVAAIFVIMALIAVVVDVAWYWSNTLEVQRAADAGALAGAPRLPGDASGAFTLAYNEAAKNGYTNGVGSVVVTPSVDPGNSRRLKVQVKASVGMFFMRVIGINSINATRSATAEFVLPVPMGSPQNYYGVFGLLRTPGGGTNVPDPATDTGWYRPVGPSPNGHTPNSPPNWTNPENAYIPAANPYDNIYATNATGASQQWRRFGIPSIPVGSGPTTILGIEVRFEGLSTDSSGCSLRFALSWDGGSSWTSGSGTGLKDQAVTNIDTQYTLGGSDNSVSARWNRTWSTGNFTDANFRVRVTDLDPGSNCTDSATSSLDALEVRVHYQTSTFVPDANVASPYGAALSPQGFWGTMINQGAEKINGDAYLPNWDTRTSSTNAEYQATVFYNYGIEAPAGSSNELWIYDPVFCATSGSGQYGTGDRWFGGTNQPSSAYYTLYNTNNTPYDFTDDTVVASSGTLFEAIRASDTTLNGPANGGATGISDCSQAAGWPTTDGRYYHLRWWQVPATLSGGATGRVYRLHTTTSGGSYVDGNGHNSFSLWTSSGGRIYGLGAMQAFTPVSPPSSAEFYLAQIDAVHAGKTVEIRLWDPGDMPSGIAANLQILQPTSGGPSAISFNWESEWGTNHSSRSSCNGNSGTTTAMTTNTGSASQFNGCWVTITIPLPSSYTAPTNPGDPGPGWWKIRYNFPSGSGAAYDLTTWEVTIKGKPVHLVP